MDEEKLINLVKEHGELYDPAHRQYQDQLKRELAWKKIANKMKMQAHECKERWKKLRENYRKAIKLRQTQKAKGIKKLKRIKHGHLMTFIADQKEIEYEEVDTHSAGHSRKTEIYAVEPNPVDPLVLERNYETAPRTDTVVTFFTNLGETVKTFPKDVQIRVKRDIFRIINEAEEEVVMNKFKW
ncbi:uncharacterized protein LOC134670529 [Cydia fagiglandana]|uniref:uncharacterized protein LOC134670529 n=1 Tax=Cydia fagiglandana TaxID=1458189 RepID=UPI002FEE1A58